MDGRVPGRRGLATRQRLLDCTKEMLETSTYRDLKVIDIAREAGTSPATFYQYFGDIDAAILVLGEEVVHQGERLHEVVRGGTWKRKAGWERALALADAFVEFWEQHRSVLRVIDLNTEEGDQRFRQVRTRLLANVNQALADEFGRCQAEAKQPIDLDPRAVAAVLVSMLAHVAQYRDGFERWGIRSADLRASTARQLYWGLTGQKPPAP